MKVKKNYKDKNVTNKTLRALIINKNNNQENQLIILQQRISKVNK